MRRIYWIFIGPRETPSCRIHGFRVHEYLLRRGWDSSILFAPVCWTTDPPLSGSDLASCSAFQAGDTVVFQKVQGPNTRSALAALNKRGVATVYVDCDLPLKLDEARRASQTICSSEYLADRYRRNGLPHVRCIPDAYEWTNPPKIGVDRDRFRCVWFGNITPEKWSSVDDLRRLLAASNRRWTVVRVADHPDAEVAWSIATASKAISECDAAVIPLAGGPEALAKSSNRAIQAMALGLPVIAYPIPAYVEVIQPGRNGFLCRTDSEWLGAFRALENPETLARMSRCAYRFARRYFSIEQIGRLWEMTLAAVPSQGVGTDREWVERPEDYLRELQMILLSRETHNLVSRVVFG
jgi:hypothetical protein